MRNYKVNWIKCENEDNEQRKLVFIYIPATESIEIEMLNNIFRNITAGIINGHQQYVRNFTTIGPFPGVTHYAEIPRIEIYPDLWNKTDNGEIPDNKDDNVLIINKDGDLEYVHIQDEFYSSKTSQSQYWLPLPSNLPE